MKDIVISGKRISCELWCLLGCFVLAFGVNIYAVIHYARPVQELFTQVGFMTITALAIYILTVILRVFLRFFVFLLKKMRKKSK